MNDKKKISTLVVEDDLDVIDFILIALEDIAMDFDITTASDSHTINSIMEKNTPDLIILDLMMPGTTGFIVCKNYRQRPGTEKTKILAITGYDTPENKDRILECGADDYLAKPFSLDILKQKIESFFYEPK